MRESYPYLSLKLVTEYDFPDFKIFHCFCAVNDGRVNNSQCEKKSKVES